MQTRSLSGPAIAAIRALIMAKCSRGDIKQFLLEAGANHQRVLAIPVHEGIRSPGYKSKNDIVNLGFDTVYQDFEPVEANGIALQLVRIVVQRKGLERDDSALQEVEGPLVACGFSLGDQARKVFGSLRGLAGNAYEAAHEFSDRHAHGDEAPRATAFVADLLASSSATLILTIAGALRRGELRAISRTKNENR